MNELLLHDTPVDLFTPVNGFSAIVDDGQFVFLAGMTGRDATGRFDSAFDAQCRKTFENMAECLRRRNCVPADLVQMQICYVESGRDIVADFRTLIRIKEEVLPGSSPVGMMCKVTGLMSSGMLIEIMATARKSS